MSLTISKKYKTEVCHSMVRIAVQRSRNVDEGNGEKMKCSICDKQFDTECAYILNGKDLVCSSCFLAENILRADALDKFTDNPTRLELRDIHNFSININIGSVVHGELYIALDALKNGMLLSNLTDDDKLDFLAKIGKIRTQLARRDPDRSVIRKAWKKIAMLSQVADLAALVEMIYRLIKPFLS